MRDLLGSAIREGSLLWWISKAIPLRVARIEPGGILAGDHDGPPTPDRLILEVTIPVQPRTQGAETQIADFLCVVNPEAEQVIEKMMAENRAAGKGRTQ